MQRVRIFDVLVANQTISVNNMSTYDHHELTRIKKQVQFTSIQACSDRQEHQREQQRLLDQI